jgi:hypothetical protein
METSTRIIDCYLKECIVGQNSKITPSGSAKQPLYPQLTQLKE